MLKAHREKGFTLIEIIMAMAILVIGVVGVVRLLPVGLRASKSSEMISRAAFFAREKMEELKLAGFDAISGPEVAIPLEGEDSGFSWNAQISEVSLEGVSVGDIRRVDLSVSWQERNRQRLQKFVTYIGGFP